MPIAFVLELQCQEDGAIYGLTGQHAFRFWEQVWNGVTETLGASRIERHADRAFTLSPLMGVSEMRHRRTPLLAGDNAQLRLASLDDMVNDVVHESLLRLVGEYVVLGGVRWKLLQVIGPESDNPHTGTVSYLKLSEQHHYWRPIQQENWKLALTTPTVVRLDNGQYLPFPLPSAILSLWLERWIEFAPASAPFAGQDISALAYEIASKLALNRYRLKAIDSNLMFDRDFPEAGCVGKLVLTATSLSRSEFQIVSTMVDYAFYCGTGIHTELGLGQTRTERPLLNHKF